MPKTEPKPATIGPRRRTWPVRLRNDAIVLAIALLLAYCGASIYMCDTFTLAYRHNPVATPASVGLAYESVIFPAAEDGLLLHGWLIPSTTPSPRLIIITHGKGDNRADGAIGNVNLIAGLATHGFTVLTYDLRGHGESQGERLSLGQYEQRDVLGATRYAVQRGFDPAHIGAYGYSMGGASTILAAAQTPDIHAVMTDSAYASAARLLDHYFRNTGILQGILPGVELVGTIRYGFDVNRVVPEQAITKLGSRHIYLIQGLADDLVNPEDVDWLAAAAGSSLRGLWKLPGIAHVNTYTTYPDEYLRRMLDFFNTELA